MIRSHQQTIGALPDCQKELKGWKDKFEMNNLNQLDLIQFFQQISPYFLTIEPKDDPSELGCCAFDEAGAKAAIIDILEELICGDNPQLVLEKIKTDDNVPSVCGRVFKIGEPTYSCRECSMDPTCVLCANCFNKSTHRHHKYKMSTSGGGGCCDCGDQEAWKRDPYCDEHKLGIEKQGESKIVTERMKKICQIAFRSILTFCTKSFQVKGENMNPSDYDVDIYCTILYNDEVHTFEQVISTLTNIIKCGQKEAIDYVTAIDREGRAVVKCATYQLCKKMQQEIERKPVRTLTSKNAPLKVDVLHKDIVACQFVTMYLLSWFQDFLSKHQAFRAIFHDIITESGNPYALKNILLNDISLWKEARTSWHRLLISGMLMEYENKKKLAVVFTQKYSQLMQEFIRDDHFHTFSVASLSVQLYTVPTVAHHLIAEEDAFFKLLHTFYTETIEKHVKNHVLSFEKNTSTHTVFKRAVYILVDLKYLLSFKPDTWTQELRLGFLHGVQQLVKFLKVMQGMDAVTRQVGQHMEYEPEWESAFTLHIKLANIITLVLDWCSTDQIVLVKVYRMVIAALLENKFIISQTKAEVRELADHSANCLQYDVLSKPVSIHLPLTRFLAGLYINFEKYGLDFDTIAGNAEKPTPEQIIEPVLCARTMISQVFAGMWRRNGYSLLNQLFFYRNVRCRAEMLDRDVVILQMGASLIESNEFLIHLLNKFNLLAWASPNYEPNTSGVEEDGVRQIANMIDEFLELLIIIIGERYTPGIGNVTEDDRLKKEIIQQLCIKPFLHSELIKSLNEDSNGETGMENVINDVAVFKKPSQVEKIGVYQLKEEYLDDYNMYFYHYSKEEKSKSEEAQRKRKQEKNELVCCPPPKLPKLTQSFSMLANMLQCDVMLQCIQTVLKRALDLHAITFLESHLAKTLHLIGYALQEEESGHYPFLIFLERSSNWGLLPLLEELAKSPRVESQRDLIVWVIKKFKELKQHKTDQEMQPEPETETMQSETQQSAAIAEQAVKEERARLAAKRRAQILAQMASAQKTFMEGNAELFKEANEESMRASTSSAGAMEWLDIVEEEDEQKVENCCLGPNRKIVRLEDKTYTCILCSEDAVVSRYGPSMVYPAFIQKSSVLSRYQKTNDGVLQYLETTIHPSPHTSTCGHVMHIYCFKQYFENEKSKESRRPYRNRTPVLFDVEKNEFLCPLCRFLSNSVLPLVPALSSLNEGPNDLKRALDSLDFNTWLEIMDEYTAQLPLEYPSEGDFKKEVTGMCTELYESKFVKIVNEKFGLNIEMEKAGPEKHLNSIFGDTTEENVNNFVNSIKTISPYHAQAPGIEQFLVTWLSCGYTIESLEMLLRATEKPLKGEMSIRYTSCLSGLVRVSGILCSNNSRANIEMISHLKSVYDILLARKSACVLEWDLFGMMVMLIFTTRSVLGAGWGETSIPKGERVDHSIVKSIFLATILRILTTYEPSSDMNDDTYMDEEDQKPIPEHEKLLSFYYNYNIYLDENNAPVTTASQNISTRTLIEQIKLQCHTFLRCSCLLFNFMTDVELPDELQYLGGDTFEVMTSYLGLSSDITSYFDDAVCVNFMTRLAEHPDIIEFKRKILDRRTDEIVPIVSPVTPIRQLITLPDDYIDVINSVSLFTCPNNEKDESRNPTMCLVCGEILCSQTYCCQKDIVVQDAIRKDKNETIQVGACTYHMHSCGAGIGIFLRIRDAEILLLGPNKGCFISAPYLDDYGETDQGLRRGNPLHLCQERYKKLHLMWLSHGIHEEIVRRTEAGQNQYATQWQNF